MQNSTHTHSVNIPNVPSHILAAHQVRAEKAGISMEEHLRALLSDTAQPESKKSFAEKMRQRHAEQKKSMRLQVDTTTLLRQERDGVL